MRLSSLIDPDFGHLAWDAEQLAWLGATTAFDGSAVQLRVETISFMTKKPPFDDETWDRTITLESRNVFAVVRQVYSAVRSQFLKSAFLDYPRWNDGNQIDPSEFARRMTLESVVLLPDGTAELFFDDGGMFGGHAFILHLDPDGVVFDEEMFG